MSTYYIICDYREKFSLEKFTDHYSYKSINKIKETIINLGYNCIYFGGTNDLIYAIDSNNYDKAGIYLNFNDGINSTSKRGQTPILLELMCVKYSGSSPLVHLVVSDKNFTNKFLSNKITGLRIPFGFIIKNGDFASDNKIKFPVILKPNNEGSSLGIDEHSICANNEEILKQYKKIKKYGDILVQEYINGFELTNYFIRSKSGVMLMNYLLLVSKNDDLKMDHSVFTPNDKFSHKRTFYNPSIILNKKEIDNIKRITNLIADELDIVSIGRIDYKYLNGELWFLEANTVPAFSESSDVGEICKIYNIAFKNIVKIFLQSINQ